MVNKEIFDKIITGLSELHLKAQLDDREKRRAGRIFYGSALAGGAGHFFLLAGPRLRMNWWKIIFYLYTVSFVSKTTGGLGLMLYSIK